MVSSEELLERVWDANADPFTTTVRVTMMTLRRKLGEPGLIETVVGSGTGSRRATRHEPTARRARPVLTRAPDAHDHRR